MLSHLHRLLDGVQYLFAQLRALLEIVVLSQESQPRLLSAAARRGEVETVLDLLEELVQSAPAPLRKEVQKVSKQVRLALPALLSFAELDCPDFCPTYEEQRTAIHILGILVTAYPVKGDFADRYVLQTNPPDIMKALTVNGLLKN